LTAAPAPTATARAIFAGIVAPRPAPLLPTRLAILPRGKEPADALAAPSLQADSGAVKVADEVVGDLMLQISRAAAQGLLEADLSETERAVRKATPPTVPAQEAEKKAPLAPLPPGSHVRITTGMDRDLGARFGRLLQEATGEVCLPDSAVDVLAWKKTGYDGSDLAAYRSELLDAREAAQPDAVMDLARHLIALTFGAEARAVLRTFAGEEKPRPLLLAMAEIVDFGVAEAAGPLAGQSACPTAAALWAVLAQETLPEKDQMDREAILTAFSALPLHLRRHLGPTLSERFLAAGLTDEARSIRNAIARAPGDHGPAFEVMEAQIEIADGRHEAAGARLEEASEEDRTAQALALSIEHAVGEGKAVADETLQNAAALAYEMKGTPMGVRLKRAQIEALLAGRRFRDALSALDDAARTSSLGPEAVVEVRVKIYARGAADAPDADFLALAFRADAALGADESAFAARRALARRLLKHGLGGQAAELVLHEDALPSVEDRLILAEAALQDLEAERGLGYLAGLDLPEADALRQEAERLMAGRPAAAPEAASEIVAEPQASQGLTLDESRNLLEDSSAARARLDALLNGADAES
jgi:hypothetical protein